MRIKSRIKIDMPLHFIVAKTSAADFSANSFIYRFIDSANTIEFGLWYIASTKF